MTAIRVPHAVRDLKQRRLLRAERRAADTELIASALPSPRLAWRVHELVAAEKRLAVARDVTDAVHDADGNRLPGASPLNRVVVREVRPQLLALASRLADLETAVLPRGVLLAEWLVSDSRSPLYDRALAGRARREVDRAIRALEQRADA